MGDPLLPGTKKKDPWSLDPDTTLICLDCRKVTPHRLLELPIDFGNGAMVVVASRETGMALNRPHVLIAQCLACKAIQRPGEPS